MAAELMQHGSQLTNNTNYIVTFQYELCNTGKCSCQHVYETSKLNMKYQ